MKVKQIFKLWSFLLNPLQSLKGKFRFRGRLQSNIWPTNTWKCVVEKGGQHCTGMLFWLFCIPSEDSLLKIPRTNWTELNLLPSPPSFIWSNKSEIQTKWQMMDAMFTLDCSFNNLTQASKTFHQMRNATTSKVRRQRFSQENLKRFRLCSQLPEASVKTKEVHAKFEAEEDFTVVIHKQGKKFFSERTWWGVWKTGRDLRCLPALSFSVSLISWQTGESRLWNSLTTEK